MAVTLAGVVSGNSTTAVASWDLVCPSVQAGDLLVHCAAEQLTTPAWTWDTTAWVDISHASAVRTNLNCGVAVKMADGTEGGTTITVATGTNKHISTGLCVFRGIGRAHLASQGANGTAATNVPVTTISLLFASLSIVFAAQQSSGVSGTWTPPTNYTEAWHQGTTNNPGISSAMFYRLAAPAGATGTLTAVGSLTSTWAISQHYFSRPELNLVH